MIDDTFKIFATAVRAHFAEMSQETLFTVAADRDVIWQTYLESFPPGTNPVFRKRTDHDCSCCRGFIRDIGNVVAVQNGVMVSVWDLNGLSNRYQTVADAMSAYVKSLPISNIYLTPFSKHGTLVSHEFARVAYEGATPKPVFLAPTPAYTPGPIIANQAVVHTWDHFYVEVPQRFVSSDHVERRGNAQTTHSVLSRGLTDLQPDALATVADLIQDNAIYRGQEFQSQVLEFQRLQSRFLSINDERSRDLFVWTIVNSPVARFRNTVIGTLVQDLSEGVDLEMAVRSFESKVAPTNYKRPTALITKAMVQSAMKTIEELGLEHALERRHARLSDVDVNSVLFVDNSVRGKMKGGIEDLLMQEVKPIPFDAKHAKEIHIDEFVSSVLPKTTSLQLYLDNQILKNFVSMIAPVHEKSYHLFRWDNDFAWSYDGNVTDSIKDRVKRAGGMVENVALRASLAWFNTDDLDIHVTEPNKNHICFRNKDGKLDVDMNVLNERTVRDPVENVRWPVLSQDGTYTVYVHNFTKRESVDVGFIVEIESNLGVDVLRFDKALPGRHEQLVAKVVVRNRLVQWIEPGDGIVRGSSSQEKWGLKSLDLVRVNSVVLSPNHWGDRPTGNKHWFFILDGCKNPLPTRGIYNEFLHPRFDKHRKVFEVLGDKTKCAPASEQLSGVGFSSTQKDKVTVVAMGPNLRNTYTIAF